MQHTYVIVNIIQGKCNNCKDGRSIDKTLLE